jgi:hypothetical protein
MHHCKSRGFIPIVLEIDFSDRVSFKEYNTPKKPPMSNARLSSVQNFNVNNITVSEANPGFHPNTYRIFIGVEYPDGSTGPLIFSTDELYSFGVQQNMSFDVDPVTKEKRVTGYSMPLCLWNSDGPTQHQTDFINTIEDIVKFLKDYLLQDDVKEEINHYELEPSDLKKLSPIFWKREKGKIVEGKGPTLYPKLLCNKELKIYTLFGDVNGNELDPLDLIGKRFHTKACIKIESIFVGAHITLQIKVIEAEIKFIDQGRPRLLLQTPVVKEQLEIIPANNGVSNPLSGSGELSEDETTPAVDSEGFQQVPKPKPRAAAKRRLKVMT